MSTFDAFGGGKYRGDAQWAMSATRPGRDALGCVRPRLATRPWADTGDEDPASRDEADLWAIWESSAAYLRGLGYDADQVARDAVKNMRAHGWGPPMVERERITLVIGGREVFFSNRDLDGGTL